MHNLEYAVPKWKKIFAPGANTVWNDSYLQENQGGCYRFYETYVADDIYQANLSECFTEALQRFQIKAFATAPIYMGKQLWGVLAVYQHSQPRHWLDADVLLLSQTATSLGLALQHTAQSVQIKQQQESLSRAAVLKLEIPSS